MKVYNFFLEESFPSFRSIKEVIMRKGIVSKFKIFFIFICLVCFISACLPSPPNKEANSAIEKPKMEIQTAVLSGDLGAVKQHISAGTNLNEPDPFTKSTPLMAAATFNKEAIAKTLIDAGADLSIKNNDGATPLHVAAFFGRIEIVQMLLDAGADKGAVNNMGAIPRQTVAGPFEEMKPIYEMIGKQLQPMGFQLDIEELGRNRPIIAEMLL